jgi:gliding motility-associated-like protein
MFGSAMQHPTVTPPATTTYFVTVTDPFGCTSVDSVEVKVLDVICSEPYIFIPNAFSPNNDSENDILYVYAPMAKDVYLAIYTRWGEMVFVTDDISHGWDGTKKGEPMTPDVFVYYLKVTCQNNKIFEKSGNITLIR